MPLPYPDQEQPPALDPASAGALTGGGPLGNGPGLFGSQGGFNDPFTAALFAMGQSFAAGQGPTGFMQGYQQQQKLNQDRAIEGEKLKKIQQENALNEQFAPIFQNPGAFSPDVLDAVAMKLALHNHAGAVGLSKIAEQRRAQEDNATRFAEMKSKEGQGGLFAGLTESPYVGAEAKRYQAELDQSAKGSAAEWMKRREHLQDIHFKSWEAANKREEGPPVAVMTPQGPKFVSRKDALGKTPANIAGAASITAPSDVHGDDYLKTLPSGTAGLVQKIANYEIDPKTLSTRGGQREQLLAHVAQYNPGYDQTQFAARNKVRQDFTSGKTANNVTAINTAIGHMATLKDLYEAMNNGDAMALNAVKNQLAKQTGDPRLMQTDVAIGAVSNEMMRVFRQVGASEAETKDWERKFSSSASPRQSLGVIKTGAELLESRINALNDQWDRGMGTKGGYPNLVSPKSAKFLESMRTPASSGSGGGGWTPEKEQRYQELLRKRGGS